MTDAPTRPSPASASRVPPHSIDAEESLLGAMLLAAGSILVLPAAAPGIVSGALLAVARAAGETAPLLFTILTLNTVNRDLFHGANTTLSVQIFRNAQGLLEQAGAVGAALFDDLGDFAGEFTRSPKRHGQFAVSRRHRRWWLDAIEELGRLMEGVLESRELVNSKLSFKRVRVGSEHFKACEGTPEL